jgi:hypothetical protein
MNSSSLQNMVSVIHGQNSATASAGITQISKHMESLGYINLEEFLDFIKQFPTLISPLLKIQLRLRQDTFGDKFWKQLSKKRHENVNLTSFNYLLKLYKDVKQDYLDHECSNLKCRKKSNAQLIEAVNNNAKSNQGLPANDAAIVTSNSIVSTKATCEEETGVLKRRRSITKPQADESRASKYINESDDNKEKYIILYQINDELKAPIDNALDNNWTPAVKRQYSSLNSTTMSPRKMVSPRIHSAQSSPRLLNGVSPRPSSGSSPRPMNGVSPRLSNSSSPRIYAENQKK